MSGPIHYHPESSNQGNGEQPIETANAPASVPLTAFSLWAVTMRETLKRERPDLEQETVELRLSAMWNNLEANKMKLCVLPNQPEFVKKESVLHQVKEPISKNLDRCLKDKGRKITDRHVEEQKRPDRCRGAIHNHVGWRGLHGSTTMSNKAERSSSLPWEPRKI
ncbi:hypothetical protein B9Z55_007841 [Caenorhabditis nigoni]|nr:hypothetical protein B9Z55_007841 [Caenorhabditis nigoni]